MSGTGGARSPMASSYGRAVLIRGPTLNSKIFLTALPDRFEDLMAKASNLFHVPPEHTPHLYVACQASVGTPHSEQRGARLLADAMPFLRDRELLTLRWMPTESTTRRPDTPARVQWDPRLAGMDSAPAAARMFQQPSPTAPTPRPAPTPWRGPQARAAHAVRVLERERAYQMGDDWSERARKAALLRPGDAPCRRPYRDDLHTYDTRDAPMSPPPSSPTFSPTSPASAMPADSAKEVPPSPSPIRADGRLPVLGVSGESGESDEEQWEDQLQSGALHAFSADDAAIPRATERTPLARSLGEWCARLNPKEAQDGKEEEACGGEKIGEAPHAQNGTKARDALKYEPAMKTTWAHSPPRPSRADPAYDTMAQVLHALDGHPCNSHFDTASAHGSAGTLAAIRARVEQRGFGTDAPLSAFTQSLSAFWDEVEKVYGAHTAQASEAGNLRRFSKTLVSELLRARSDAPKRSAGVPGESRAAPPAKRARRASERVRARG
ncbi:hypothetical protein MSPP1_001185 [Malassezia sp. CBS 17886]|nr:hypothetical protein MSPP1_001185 [Malassezia sp. CBS 17886]